MSSFCSSNGPPVIIQLVAQPLTKENFAPFGEVIQNPLIGGSSTNLTQQLQLDAPGKNLVEALPENQEDVPGHVNITATNNFYSRAPSRRPAQAVLRMAAYAPQPSSPAHRQDEAESAASDPERRYEVQTLQRHPFTAKTLIPLGVSAFDRTTQYLIIVAPTLPPSRKRQARPPPFPPPEPRRRRSLVQLLSRARPPPFPENPAKPAYGPGRKARLPGPGPPDLQNARAFVANPSHAVTYGPGVWHAPVVVLGTRPVEFAQVRFCNGVPQEDRQDVQLSRTEEEEGEQAGLMVLLASDSRTKPNQVVVKAKL